MPWCTNQMILFLRICKSSMSTSAVQSCKLFQVVMRLSLFIWFCLMVGPFLVESLEVCPEHISTSAIFAALSALHTNITNVTDQHSLCEVGLSWTRKVVIFSSGEENPSGKAFATFKCKYSMPSSEWIVLKETVRFNNQTNITAPELAGLPNCTHCNNPGTESFGDQSFCQVDDPPCDPSPCHNGGSCVQTSLRNYSCSCRVFQSGRNCNECSLNRELCNGGTVSNECTCVCPGRFSGEFCNECSLTTGSCNGGTVSRECTCLFCPEPFRGEFCNECSLNRELCNAYGGTVSNECACVCPGHFSGEFCNECSLTTGLCNGGTVSSRECTCVCPGPFSGEFCNECSLNKELCNGGNVSTDCTCVCPGRFSGEFCNECSLNKELCNGGNVSKECACVCPEHFSGEFCNECSLNKELCNGGTVSNECACVCPEHFTGEYCNECSVTTGLCNGGTVSRDCTCVCPGPFSGEFCNVLADVMTSEKPADGVDGKGIPTSDPKDLSFDSIGEKNDSGNTSNLGGDGLGHLLGDLSDLLKCSLNTGSCNGGTVSIDCACVCPERFTGEYCNECSVTTGSCNGGTVSRECTCVCPGRFSGEFCNECALHCANGGTLDTESCTCGCSGGFTGPSCDISASDVSSSEVDTTSYIALYVCVGLAVFFTLVVGSVIVAHFIKKRRRAIIKQKRRSRKHRNSVAPI